MSVTGAPSIIDALVEQAQAGDGNAWADIYARFRPDIYRFLHARLTIPAEDVADLTEEVFVKAFAKLGTFRPRPGATFRSWLYMIARNTRIDYLRALRSRARTQPLETSGEALDARISEHAPGRVLDVAVTSGPEESGIAESLDLQAALEALPEDQRKVVTMKYVQGLALPEVARVLMVPGWRVKELHDAALAALREALS